MAIINTINTHQAQFSFNRVDTAADPVVRQTSAGKNIDTPQNDPVPLQKPEASRVALGQRQTINSSLNNAAVSIRTADRTMETIGKHISSMKSQLEIIVKNYPPFPPDSDERIRALRSYSAFRKEIDALTIPPPLNIPVLADTAADAEVSAALKSLDTAQAALNQRRAVLSMDWAKIVPLGKYADLAAEQTSINLRSSIAQQESSLGFTDIRPLLSQLMA